MEVFPEYALIYSHRRKENIRISKKAIRRAIANKESLVKSAYDNFLSHPAIVDLCNKWKLETNYKGHASKKGVPKGNRLWIHGGKNGKKKRKGMVQKPIWTKRSIHVHEPTQTKVLDTGDGFRVMKGDKWLGSFPRLADARSFVENN